MFIQINDGKVCVDMYSRKLKKIGETSNVSLPWQPAGTRLFTRRKDSPDPAPDEIWNAAKRHYDEKLTGAGKAADPKPLRQVCHLNAGEEHVHGLGSLPKRPPQVAAPQVAAAKSTKVAIRSQNKGSSARGGNDSPPPPADPAATR